MLGGRIGEVGGDHTGGSIQHISNLPKKSPRLWEFATEVFVGSLGF